MLSKKLVSGLFFLLCTSMLVFSQPVGSPELRCLEVTSAGDVNLSWTIPPDPGNTFVAYHIYKNNSWLATINNRLTGTYADIGAGANTQSYAYFLVTESFTGVTVISNAFDTLSTMFLQVNNPGNNVAAISWSAPRTPLLTTSNAYYKVYKDYPSGWVFVDSTQSLTLSDTNYVCNELISYRVELGDAFGCVSRSNQDGDVFKDNTVPAGAGLDSVSVDGSNNATVSWYSSTSPDVNAYVIYQYINSLWVAIDTVYGYSTTFFTNANSSADVSSEWYAVAAMDSCKNLSPLGNYQQTILLNTSIDRCSRSASLNWTGFVNWPAGVASYSVYVSKDGAPYALIGTTGPGSTTFTHTGLVANSNYCYYVRAKDGTGLKTSSSNRKCVFASLPVMPNFTYDQSSSVISPGEVKVDVFVDVNASTSGFRFERADNASGPFENVGYVPFSGSPSIFIIDATAKTESQPHYYQVITLDSCGIPSQTSNLVKTIFAQGTANSDMTNTITWNDYQGFDGGVITYDLYRSVDGSAFAPVATINFGTTSYVDDVSAFMPGEGKFEYYLVANEGPGNIYSITASAASNIAEVFQPSKFFVPNAFVPGGLNPIFIPVGSFYDKSEYTFLVYNRWGQEVFSTDKTSEGWDGTCQGSVVQQGVYAWFIKYKASNGEYVEMSGTVTVIGK